MTLDEAIKHCEEVAEKNEWFEKNYLENKGCKECANEHRQLAEWLKELKQLRERNCFGCKYSKDNHNAGTEECHLCMWENQYTPTTKNDLAVDCISRQEVLDLINADWKYENLEIEINNLAPVTPQEPRCKECKWWKDSDGEYRRGCMAESKCPINRREVFDGNGYCYMFEPRKVRDK